MKHAIKYITIILLVFLTYSYNALAAPIQEYGQTVPSIAAQSAILIDRTSGKILYEKNAYVKMYPASTTKIMTALVAIDVGSLDNVITIGNEINYIAKDASVAGLVKGEQITLRDLIYALMLPSGNDAAYSIAVYSGRVIANNNNLGAEDSIKLFVSKMNEKAASISAFNTNFVNPDGYHDVNHYTTAYDLALIAREAMKQDFLREVASTQSYKVDLRADNTNINTSAKTPLTHIWKNKNELVLSNSKYYYGPATGIKTGYTTPAGYCLVSSASLNELDVIAVILKSTEQERMKDSKDVLSYAFENFQKYSVLSKGQVIDTVEVAKVKKGSRVNLDITTNMEYSDVFQKDKISSIKKEVKWNKKIVLSSDSDTGEVLLKGPISAGTNLGKVEYSLNGAILAEADVYAAHDAMKREITDVFLYAAQIPFFYWIVIILASLFIIFILNAKKRRKKRLRKA